EAREALAGALARFPGTVLFVSHDRAFVDAVGTRVLAVSPQGVDDFGGNYEDYLHARGEDYLDIDSARRMAAAPQAARVAPGGRDEQRKEARRNLAALRKAVERLEAEIAVLEAELERLEAGFADGGYYARTDHDQVARDVERRDAAQARLREAM